MWECLIVGDSIAVGTQRFRPECAVYAKGGYNSGQWNKSFSDKFPLEAKTVVISLGSNDHAGVKTEAELIRIRRASFADRVFWIVPAIKPHIQDIVKRVAESYGDTVIPIKSLEKDKVHPSWNGYKDIAERSK